MELKLPERITKSKVVIAEILQTDTRKGTEEQLSLSTETGEHLTVDTVAQEGEQANSFGVAELQVEVASYEAIEFAEDCDDVDKSMALDQSFALEEDDVMPCDLQPQTNYIGDFIAEESTDPTTNQLASVETRGENLTLVDVADKSEEEPTTEPWESDDVTDVTTVTDVTKTPYVATFADEVCDVDAPELADEVSIEFVCSEDEGAENHQLERKSTSPTKFSLPIESELEIVETQTSRRSSSYGKTHFSPSPLISLFTPPGSSIKRRPLIEVTSPLQKKRHHSDMPTKLKQSEQEELTRLTSRRERKTPGNWWAASANQDKENIPKLNDRRSSLGTPKTLSARKPSYLLQHQSISTPKSNRTLLQLFSPTPSPHGSPKNTPHSSPSAVRHVHSTPQGTPRKITPYSSPAAVRYVYSTPRQTSFYTPTKTPATPSLAYYSTPIKFNIASCFITEQIYLPEELLIAVFQYLDSSRDLCSLACCSKRYVTKSTGVFTFLGG